MQEVVKVSVVTYAGSSQRLLPSISLFQVGSSQI